MQPSVMATMVREPPDNGGFSLPKAKFKETTQLLLIKEFNHECSLVDDFFKSGWSNAFNKSHIEEKQTMRLDR